MRKLLGLALLPAPHPPSTRGPTNQTSHSPASVGRRLVQFGVVWALALLGLGIGVVGQTGCTTVSTFRAPVDLPLSDQQFEVGGGVSVLGGPNNENVTKATGANGGVGLMGFGVYRTPWPVDVFVMGHGAGTLGLFPDVGGPGFFAGGQVGIRGRVEAIEGLVLSLEGYADYLEQNIFGRSLRHVSGVATVTVAENAYGPLWVYIRPTVGISIPLYKGAEFPFFGISEMPVGLTVDVTRNLSVRAEGGYHIPSGMIMVSSALVGSF